MQKPDKLYSYADFQDDLRNAIENGQDQNGFKEAALNTQCVLWQAPAEPK